MGTLKVNNIQSVTDGSVNFPQGLSSNIQPISIPDGSVSNPSLKFTNDSDTGLYRIGSNTIGIASNGIRVGEIGNGYGGFTGNVIQVKTLQDTTRGTTTLDTFVSFMTLSFTPIYSTSDILIMFNSGAGGGGASNVLVYSIFRDSTAIGQSTAGSSINSTGGSYLGSASYYTPISASVIESANNTTSRNYSLRIRSGVSGQTVAIGGRAADAAVGGYSLLTVMEIQK